MKNKKLLILFSILIIGGIIITSVSSFIIMTQGIEAKDAIPLYAGIVGFFVTMITTIYKELSEQYAEKRAQSQKRWELVFPMIKDSYIPWIGHALKLHEALGQAKIENNSDYSVNRVLYGICLFYGHRLRFLLKHGGAILLETKTSENEIETLYQNIKKSFQWAGDDTPKMTSKLQAYFIQKDKEHDPVVFDTFDELLNQSDPEPNFKNSKEKLSEWLKNHPNNITNAQIALKNFAEIFDSKLLEFSGREE